MINTLIILDVASFFSTVFGGILDFISYIIKFIIYAFDLYNLFVDLIPSPFKEMFSIIEMIFIIIFAAKIKNLFSN